MIKILTKWISFACVMLLVGQIPLGGETIGLRFDKFVRDTLGEGTEKLLDSKVLGELSVKVPFLKSLLKTRKKEEPQRPKKRPISEEISQAERESLYRLLQ